MPRQPNILIVHCHDLGQLVGCYGARTVRTPHLDAFAASGVRLANAFTVAPHSSPARAALFTGRYPHSSGVMGPVHGDFAWDLYPQERHLGQLLREAGYFTAAVGILHETRVGAGRCGIEEYRPYALAAKAADAAGEVLARCTRLDRPFYLQVGFAEAHRMPSEGSNGHTGFLGPHLKPDSTLGTAVPEWLEDTDAARAEVAELQGAAHEVDRGFGMVMEALRANGLERDTLVLFTTDHGPALPRARCSLYDPGLRIALLLRLPSRNGWFGGRALEPLLASVDVLPTLLDLVGVSVPDAVQGRSFVPLLDRGRYTTRDCVFSEITYQDYYDPRRAVRTESHKLILNFSSAPSFMDPSLSRRPRCDARVPAHPERTFTPPVEVYDLVSDPWEQENLAGSPAAAGAQRELLGLLRDHLEQTDDPILLGPIPSPMHRRVLSLLESPERR